MRTHSLYGQLQLWRDPEAARRWITPENLRAARIEPAVVQLLPKSLLDLVFAADDCYLVVPMMILDSPQVLARELDALIWPSVIASAIGDDAAMQIESFIFPWIRAITLGRPLNREVIRHFGTDADRALYEAARAARFTGAAKTADAAVALAPYVYATRYAFGKNVVISEANDTVQGAAYLRRYADVSVQGISAEERELARRWFGPVRENSNASADVTICGPRSSVGAATRIVIDPGDIEQDAEARIIAQPYPADLLFSYDTFHGPQVRQFAIQAPHESPPRRALEVPAYIAGGGSAGRVLFGLRPDWEANPDADTDSALELARLLGEEGLTVDLSGEPTRCDFSSYDVVHCFNLIETPSVLGFLLRARQAGKRTILTANFLDICDERTWGAETALICVKQELDDASIARYLAFFVRRALLGPDWPALVRRGPLPNYDQLVLQALAHSDTVIAETAGEAALLRERFGFAGDLRVVAPFIAPAARAAVAPPLGLERFTLLHAPIQARSNQLFAVLAARNSPVPLVVAGPVRDMEYAARVREAADGSVIFMDPRDPAEIAWLYEKATTILDASWYAFGTNRVWRAALSGAAVCASTTGWAAEFGAGLTAVDPASPDSIAQGLASARPPSVTQRSHWALQADPNALLRKVIGAYLALEPLPGHA